MSLNTQRKGEIGVEKALDASWLNSPQIGQKS